MLYFFYKVCNKLEQELKSYLEVHSLTDASDKKHLLRVLNRPVFIHNVFTMLTHDLPTAGHLSGLGTVGRVRVRVISADHLGVSDYWCAVVSQPYSK